MLKAIRKLVRTNSQGLNLLVRKFLKRESKKTHRGNYFYFVFRVFDTPRQCRFYQLIL